MSDEQAEPAVKDAGSAGVCSNKAKGVRRRRWVCMVPRESWSLEYEALAGGPSSRFAWRAGWVDGVEDLVAQLDGGRRLIVARTKELDEGRFTPRIWPWGQRIPVLHELIGHTSLEPRDLPRTRSIRGVRGTRGVLQAEPDWTTLYRRHVHNRHPTHNGERSRAWRLLLERLSLVDEGCAQVIETESGRIYYRRFGVMRHDWRLQAAVRAWIPKDALKWGDTL